MPIEKENKQTNETENSEILENKDKDINILKNEIDLTYLKDYISKNIMKDDRKMDIREKINGKEVYYVPIEDGKGNVVRYNVMYIDDDNGSEIIKLPIMDIHGTLLRFQNVARYIPMTKPILDPIDFVSLGGGVMMSFLNGLKTIAPKAGINLSKVAVQKISTSRLFANILVQEIPKEATGNVVSQGFQN